MTENEQSKCDLFLQMVGLCCLHHARQYLVQPMPNDPQLKPDPRMFLSFFRNWLKRNINPIKLVTGIHGNRVLGKWHLQRLQLMYSVSPGVSSKAINSEIGTLIKSIEKQAFDIEIEHTAISPSSYQKLAS